MTNLERLIELAAVEGLDAGIGVPLWERHGDGWVLCAKRDPSKADYRSYGPEFDQPGDYRKWAFRVPGLLPHADPAEALRLVHLWRCGREVPGRLPCGGGRPSEGDVTDLPPGLERLLREEVDEEQLPGLLRALKVTLTYEDECTLMWLGDSPDPRIAVPAIIAVGVLGSPDLDYLRSALDPALPHGVLHAAIRAVKWGGRSESYRAELSDLATCEELPQWLRDAAKDAGQ